MTPEEIEKLAEKTASRVASILADQPCLVGRERTAKLTSLSVPTIDRMTRAGEIPCIRRGSRVLYDPQEVVAALKRGGKK